MDGKAAAGRHGKQAEHRMEDDPKRAKASTPAPKDAGPAGEAEPKGTPTSGRYAAEVAHHDEESTAGAHTEK